MFFNKPKEKIIDIKEIKDENIDFNEDIDLSKIEDINISQANYTQNDGANFDEQEKPTFNSPGLKIIDEEETLEIKDENIDFNENITKKAESTKSFNFNQKKPDIFKTVGSGINNFLIGKLGRNKMDLYMYEIKDSIYFIIILALSILTVIYSFYVYQKKSDFKIISSFYETQNQVRLENEKLRANKDLESFVGILKFGKETSTGERYPQGGYLNSFDKLFPNDIGDLNILTFIEGWSSDFIVHNDKKIRIDNEIIKSFKKEETIIDNGKLKGFTFDLTLNGNPNKIRSFLYNLKYNNKIPKDFKSIKKTFNYEQNILEMDIQVIFYISK